MPNAKIRIGFIGSTQQFVDYARTLSMEQQESVEGAFALAGLDGALAVARKMERDGVEVIVCRRGAANLLQKNIAVPILSVSSTAFDAVVNVKEAASLAGKILITPFPCSANSLKTLEDMFGVELMNGVYQDAAGLENLIVWAKAQGCKAVIGGCTSMSIARKLGMAGVEIHTSEEAIASAVEDAKMIALSRREELERTLRYRTILDATSEGIIAVDRNGIVTTLNRAAREFLDVTEGEGPKDHISKYISNASILEVVGTGRQRLNQVGKIRQERFVMNHIPILNGSRAVGGILTCKDVSNVMMAENEVRRSFAKGLIARYNIGDFIYQSDAIRKVLDKVRKFAATDLTILIEGETGTGKEILAQSIHNLSMQRKGPFVSINCAALTEQLLESELFGHEEGAFTGSRRGGKPGLFELAHRGTIFLDEIGSMPMSVQAKLLRVLQEREVMRVGGDRLIPIDVRVITACNQNLSNEVKAQRFREDLYFRFNVLTFHIPPLRDRIEDLPMLLSELIIKTSSRFKFPPVEVPWKQVEDLKRLQWPGNIRQLVNFTEKLVILCEGRFDLQVFEELHDELRSYSVTQNKPDPRASALLPEMIREDVRRHEVEMIRSALEETRCNKTAAAGKLGISRTTLWRKLKKIERPPCDSASDPSGCGSPPASS